MNKVYIVKEVHDYKTEYLIGVCPNRELAEKLKNQNENLWDLEDCEITSEMWDEMLVQAYSKGILEKQSLEEIMIETYPEYSVSDIMRAYKTYMNRSYVGTIIEEINLYTSDSDITLYGIHSRPSTRR